MILVYFPSGGCVHDVAKLSVQISHSHTFHKWHRSVLDY